ncbi:DUF3231 family protein [Cohnella candidum]|uniref:DUF3231 family protein n=1 Tax=Cohnella candidum TaxID=2674991 RepID=A0A3G3K347_9BACL|nr:DUF3231 family protein [Cohnella candidum]AYQ74934.1 DUF3231 family protein [Cohnella candidum]
MSPSKPVPLTPLNAAGPLTSAEQAKLWATYMGNSMAIRVLSYMLQNVEDQEIEQTLQTALDISTQMVETIVQIFNQENYPIPAGFSEEDVNLGAKRLFSDEFYLHYLKYTGKAGMSVYGIAVGLMTRLDIREFFTQCLASTNQLMNRVNELLIAKGLMTKPPLIPYPTHRDFVKKQSYLNGFFGDVRKLHALEIAHLYENIENNATSRAVLIAFGQVAQSEQAKSYFHRGREIAGKHYDIFSRVLEKENLPAPPILDPYVTTSTFSPFSEKLMLYHKLDMYSMRIRSYGNALAFCARHDLAQKYGRLLLEVGNYLEDGANILIDHGWMEQPPQAVDREALSFE